jgi:hypothetical protein
LVSKLLMVIRWRDLLDEKMDTIGTRILMRMVLIMIIEKEGKKRFVFFFLFVCCEREWKLTEREERRNHRLMDEHACCYVMCVCMLVIIQFTVMLSFEYHFILFYVISISFYYN